MGWLRPSLWGMVLWIGFGFLAAGLPPAGAMSAQSEPIRIGLSPVFVDNDPEILDALGRYLEARLGRPVRLLQRAGHTEMLDLLRRGEVDFAWICTNSYLCCSGPITAGASAPNCFRFYRAWAASQGSDPMTTGSDNSLPQCAQPPL